MSYLKGVKGTCEYPVTVNVPALNEKDEEILIEITPIVQFKRFKRSEARKVQAEIAKISTDAARAFEKGDVEAIFTERLDFFDDLMRDGVKGWRKMPGAEGEDVPFSAEALDEVIEDNHYYAGFMAGLRKALGWGDTGPKGSAEVDAKNS